MSSNLPPGISEGDLPGNRSEDMEEGMAWGKIHDVIEEDCYANGFTAAEARVAWKAGLTMLCRRIAHENSNASDGESLLDEKLSDPNFAELFVQENEKMVREEVVLRLESEINDLLAEIKADLL